MEDKQEKINTFAQLAEQKPAETSKTKISAPTEISVADFSDTAVGEKKKYNRENLDGQTVVVDKFQVFKADTSEEPNLSQAKTSKYWDCTVLMTYDKVNADGVNNREYLSGAKQFMNRDGSASEVNFWYEGAENQVASLWETVAEHLGVEPKDLSPRQFVAFLNSKPKAKIVSMKFKNFDAPAGSPSHVQKNMIESFVKA
jgi:hypothetical protein